MSFIWISYIFIFIVTVNSQNTIKDIILSRPELSKIAVYLKSLNLMNYFGTIQTNSITFFAPHNDAFNFMSSEMRDQLARMTSERATNLFLYHTIYRKWETKDLVSGTQNRYLVKDISCYLFISKINETCYVNGATIITPDLVATNGYVNIIDRMLVDVSLNGPTSNVYKEYNAYSFACASTSMDQRLSTTQFCKMLDALKQYEDINTIQPSKYGRVFSDILSQTDFDNNRKPFSVFFITNDQFLTQFKQSYQDKYQELLNTNAKLLQTVVESQVVPEKAYHSRLFLNLTINSTIPAVQGEIRMYMLNNQLVVSNKCKQANIIQGNITTLNSVVYIIDNFLGYVSNDLYQEIDMQSNLMNFKRCLAAMQPPEFVKTLSVPAGATESTIIDYTIFAATGDVFNRISLDSDPLIATEQMKMQFILGSKNLINFVNGSITPTLRSHYNMKFLQINNDYYVEVDYVRAKIVEANICTKNGIIHKIDRLLGVPDRTISDTIGSINTLLKLNGQLANVGYLTTLNDKSKSFTFFAPNDSAFDVIQTNLLFQQQNNRKLRNIFDRHISSTVLFLDQSSDSFNLRTNNGDIKIRNSNNEYTITVGTNTIRVLQANMRMTNGVMHLVDKLLFDPNDPTTLESVNRSYNSKTINIFLLVILVFYSIFCKQ